MFGKTKAPEAPAPFVPIPGQVMDVPVAELLRNIVYSCDLYDIDGSEAWERWLREKSKDVSFWQLVDAIPEEGFTHPIAIQLTEGGWHQSNGHHRVAAAILLGLDTIKVAFCDHEVGYSVPVWPPQHVNGPLPAPEDRRAWYGTLWEVPA